MYLTDASFVARKCVSRDKRKDEEKRKLWESKEMWPPIKSVPWGAVFVEHAQSNSRLPEGQLSLRIVSMFSS
jgi:hypothetical protein